MAGKEGPVLQGLRSPGGSLVSDLGIEGFVEAVGECILVFGWVDIQESGIRGTGHTQVTVQEHTMGSDLHIQESDLDRIQESVVGDTPGRKSATDRETLEFGMWAFPQEAGILGCLCRREYVQEFVVGNPGW